MLLGSCAALADEPPTVAHTVTNGQLSGVDLLALSQAGHVLASRTIDDDTYTACAESTGYVCQ